MKAVLIILFLTSASKAEQSNNILRCSHSSNDSFTFEPSEDNVEGRYKVDWCTKADRNVKEWKLVMNYIEKKCRSSGFSPKVSSHSSFTLPVTNNLNCTQVCFLTFLDLVFTNTCYYIMTHLEDGHSKRTSHNESYHYVINNFTKELFTESETRASAKSDDDGKVELKWYLTNVPATYYTVDIKAKTTEKRYDPSCNKSAEYQVTCLATVEVGHCYQADLQHKAYWTYGSSTFENITNIYHDFCVSMPGKANVIVSPTGEWPTALATVGLLLSIVTVWCIVRRRHVAAWQRRVREHWLQTTPTESTAPPNVEGNILLLYARDCAEFKRAAESLGSLVHRATGCRVIDVYTGAATRLWAPAVEEWLRLLLAREDTRVLLLQSPAGVLLAADLSDTRAGPGLVAPLLGSQVLWRRPHAGDALLPLALRQLAAAPSPAPYKKYYVANIAGQGADMAAGVTPLRRYTLPESAACLLRDLAPSLKLPSLALAPDLEKVCDLERPDLAPLLQHFKEAADAFTNHVREHPDYLADELLFI